MYIYTTTSLIFDVRENLRYGFFSLTFRVKCFIHQMERKKTLPEIIWYLYATEHLKPQYVYRRSGNLPTLYFYYYKRSSQLLYMRISAFKKCKRLFFILKCL